MRGRPCVFESKPPCLPTSTSSFPEVVERRQIESCVPAATAIMKSSVGDVFFFPCMLKSFDDGRIWLPAATVQLQARNHALDHGRRPSGSSRPGRHRENSLAQPGRAISGVAPAGNQTTEPLRSMEKCMATSDATALPSGSSLCPAPAASFLLGVRSTFTYMRSYQIRHPS